MIQEPPADDPGLAATNDRQIVVMHHLEELSHEAIAATLGLSVGTSRVRLARAMNRLRDHATREEVGR